MGFNHALEQDEIALFEVGHMLCLITVVNFLNTLFSQVSAYNEAGVEPVNLCLSGLKSGGPLLDKATIRCIMDGTQHPKVIDSSRDLILYKEV